MKKRSVRVFITCFLFLVMCSSVISAVAGPIVIENNCVEEHKHNEKCEVEAQDKIEKEEENSKDNKENNSGQNLDKEEDKEEDGEENKEEDGEENKEENMEENEERPKEEIEIDEKKPKEEYKNSTTDTFEKVVGPYSFDTILNKYNVFSKDTVTGAHIVGPIVGKKAYHHKEADSGSLIVSEYSKGNPSFIGELYRRKEGPNPNQLAQVGLNYAYENQVSPKLNLSVKPNLYINETGNQVKVSGTEENKEYEIVDEKGAFKGPNNVGVSPILQNDNFIDFDKAFNELSKESEVFAKNKSNILVDGNSEYKLDKDGILKLAVGKSYLIKDASKIKGIDFIHPTGFDPMKNPYPEPTIINIVDKNLCKQVIGGKRQNRLPDMYSNGVAFKGTNNIPGQPALNPGFENGEIGEMNRIIWNMPNVETIGEEGRIVRGETTDILGHIVAPKAEFWSYKIDSEGFKWTGGNMNGAAIVKSWHGGSIENHYWPYDGTVKIPEPPKVSMSVNAEKKFNKGSLDNQKFNFKLEYDGESLPDGVLNKNIPQTVQQTPDGKIKFLPITFTKEGIYNFIVKEIPGDDKDTIYDGSEYKVKITVFLENGELKYSQEITKIKDGEHESVNEIIFVNEKILNFTIEKKDNLTGNLLEGAIFDLYEADENGKPKDEPIIKDIITDATGKINISNKVLEYNKLYVLVETKAPDGYMTGENIVFYIKGEQGPYPNESGVVVIGNGGILEVLNTKSDEVLPDTGGIGTDKFVFVGLGLMLISLILLKIKVIKG